MKVKRLERWNKDEKQRAIQDSLNSLGNDACINRL